MSLTIELAYNVGTITMTSNYGDEVSPERAISAVNVEASKVFGRDAEDNPVNYKVALKIVNLVSVADSKVDTFFMEYQVPTDLVLNGTPCADAEAFMDWVEAAISSGNIDGADYIPLTSIATDFTTLNDTLVPSTQAVAGYVANAVAASNPTISVKTATKAVLPNSPTYSNGSSGVGATLTAGSNAALVVNGYSPSVNDRILVKNQASGFQNGIYVVTFVGSGAAAWVLTRATDYDDLTNINGGGVIPVESYVNDISVTETNVLWLLTSQVATIGTDALVFTQYTVGSNTVATTTGNNTFSKAQRGAFTSGTDGATVTLDLSASNNFRLVLGGSRTLGVPTNIVPGQSGVINVHQDSTGSRTLAYAWCFAFAGGTAPTLSTGKYVMDQLIYMVNRYATSTVTISIAVPGVVTWVGHGLISGNKIQFTTTGALPTGLSASTTYWVDVLDNDTFRLASSFANLQAGTFITTTGSQSGVHTANVISITLSCNNNIS